MSLPSLSLTSSRYSDLYYWESARRRQRISRQQFSGALSTPRNRRSVSEPALPQTILLPLTRANLERIGRSVDPMDPPPLPSSRADTRKSAKDNLTTRQRHQIYGIFYERRQRLPQALLDHVATMHEPRPQPSPNAKQIAVKAPAYYYASEQDGIDALKNILLFRGAEDGGQDFVRVAAKPNLDPIYLPPPPSPRPAGLRDLERPQPDTAIGYVTSDFAMDNMLLPTFTEGEERIANTFKLTSGIHFPFFTTQWKSPEKGNQGHCQAVPQGARDGAAIVNHIYELYKDARDDVEPTVVETCHFSASVDFRSILLFVHWREPDATIHMEKVGAAWLDKEGDNIEIRALLRNIQDHALGPRLASIKEAISRIMARTTASMPQQLTLPEPSSSQPPEQENLVPTQTTNVRRSPRKRPRPSLP